MSDRGAQNHVEDLRDFTIAHDAERAAYAMFERLDGRPKALEAYLKGRLHAKEAKTAGPQREGLRALIKGDADAVKVRRHIEEADRAYWRVILRHRPFLRRCAARLQGRIAWASSLEDLLALCEVGAYTAALRYDPGLPFRFITYAEPWIVARVHDEADRPAGIRVGKRTPKKGLSLVSIENPTPQDREKDELVADSIDPIDAYAEHETLLLLRRALETLPDEKRSLLQRRMAGTSLATLGDERGCTKERIRQLEQEAEGLLRRRMRAMAPRLFPAPAPCPARSAWRKK